LIINNSRKAFALLQKRFNPLQEEVWLMTLHTDMSLIAIDLLFRGTVNESLIHPRDLFRCICLNNSAAFILAHNHPSGKVSPSRQDRRATRRIQRLAKLIEVPIRDHIIFSAEKYYSFSEHKQI